MPKKDSPALTLLQHVYDHMGDKSSWRRINSSMQHALNCAIGARLRFDPTDYETIALRFSSSGYWLGDSEYSFYAKACQHDLLSACVAYETAMKRKPFYWHGKRLFVGAEMEHWGEEREQVKVTSMQQGQLIACSYRTIEDASTGGYVKQELHHRFVISRAELKAAQKGRST